MKRFFLVVCTLVSLLGSATAADSVGERCEAARRYAAAIDFSAMLSGIFNQVALTLPEESRSAYIEMMNEKIDFAKLEQLIIDWTAELYTLDEINASTEFYGSPRGQSILKKSNMMWGDLLRVMDGQEPDYAGRRANCE